MLRELLYDVTFHPTGRRITNSLIPEQAGSTLITGKNEAGKSLNLEMFAYTLFGSEALRGKADSYKKLKASSEFVVKGVLYSVARTKSGATLSSAEGILAKGTSPVNQRIREILGFGIEVFKVSNWCAQGDIKKLSNMLPTARKQMIDEVSGLTQLDGVIKWVAEVRKQLAGEIKAFEELMLTPTKPEAPKLASEESLKKELAWVKSQTSLRSNLEGQLIGEPIAPVKPLAPVAPQYPVKPPEMAMPLGPTPIPAFENLDWDDLAERNCQAFIQAMPCWLASKDQLLQDLVRLKNREPEGSSYSQEQLDRVKSDNAEIRRIETLITEREALRAKGTVECPNCAHEHYIATSLLEQYQDVPEAAPKPLLTDSQIQAAQKWLDWASEEHQVRTKLQKLLDDESPMPEEDYESYLKFVEHRDQYTKDLAQYQTAQADWERTCSQVTTNNEVALANWEQACKNLDDQHVNAKAQHVLQLKAYDETLEAYNNAVAKRSELKSQLSQLPSFAELGDRQEALSEDLSSWKVHYRDMERYDQDFARYSDQRKIYDEKDAKLQQYKLAEKALKEVKLRVKGYLVPSLSKVASQLLASMTGGERCTVVISEDFDIVVDGQALQTLSGSGQDVTNLAIRIALGQVLTHKVMPMMMFDEIDAAMDDARANYTWQCIQKVTPKIGQVLLVSHKNLVATHQIQL